MPGNIIWVLLWEAMAEERTGGLKGRDPGPRLVQQIAESKTRAV